jgi:hypothetical protein
MGGQPLPLVSERPHRSRDLLVLIAGGAGRYGARVLDNYPAQLVKLGHRLALGLYGLIFHKLASPCHLAGPSVMMPSCRVAALTRWSKLLT